MKLVLLPHLESLARKIKAFVNNLVSNLATTTTEAITELDNSKADKPEHVPLTVPVTGWVQSTETNPVTAKFPYYTEVAIQGITANDVVQITIYEQSQPTAMDCGLSPSNTTLDGAIRLRSRTIPAEPLVGDYVIEK